MVEDIKQLCLAANPEYTFYYEQAKMMNIKVDKELPTSKIAYLEEVKTGQYSREGYRWVKTTQYRLMFIQFIPMHAEAAVKEEVLNLIEAEIVKPFISEFIDAYGRNTATFRFTTPPPMFDANDVSIVLQFEHKEYVCL